MACTFSSSKFTLIHRTIDLIIYYKAVKLGLITQICLITSTITPGWKSNRNNSVRLSSPAVGVASTPTLTKSIKFTAGFRLSYSVWEYLTSLTSLCFAMTFDIPASALKLQCHTSRNSIRSVKKYLRCLSSFAVVFHECFIDNEQSVDKIKILQELRKCRHNCWNPGKRIAGATFLRFTQQNYHLKYAVGVVNCQWDLSTVSVRATH